MTVLEKRLVSLVEFERKRLLGPELSDDLARILWSRYGKQLTVEWPSPKTDLHWELRSNGWVGYIPLSNDVTIALQPKVAIANLFRMLEYAYRLKEMNFLEGLIDCTTLEEFYEVLAKVLALRIIDRERIGLYRMYVNQTERMPFLRGSLDLADSIRREWQPDFQCSFEEHTPDVEENHILAWTLSQILQVGLCTERVLPTVRHAYRGLHGFVTPTPVTALSCVGRVYNRLSDDYKPLHALCRFFLEQTGPGHAWGDRRMLPFLIDMARLYELFVAEWLKQHLPPHLRLQAQERVDIGHDDDLHFRIDLVLYDVASGQAFAVLDTKYKDVQTPAVADIEQVIAYAVSKGCHEAILVYPIPLAAPLDRMVGAIQVRSLAFRLDGDLEEGGQGFLSTLLTARN